ncbi:hypothetical protein [Micromonospora inositola]|uniref:Uncharacterized protein n=1 Tax=Micromonospora inositola TaxID=47865 RepID=A0A1C5HS51_9ACTN|nr:hypothetical protein [Micromonospora inositola]SCG48829.1 hypothetical protein GA0070613_1733 [Micromonospora inositola]
MTLPEAASARPARPAIVTVAFWLQLAAVVVLLVLVGLVVAEAVRYDGQIDRALRLVPDADPTEVSDERSGNVFMALVIGGPALLLAAWLAATALPLRRGGNTARILVFVAAGAQLLLCLGQGCSGVLLVPLALAAGMGDPGFDPAEGMPPDGADWEQSKFLDTLYAQGDPGDAVFAIGGLGVLVVLALTVSVVVLLLLPEARRWFRPQPAVPAGAPGLTAGYGYLSPGAVIPYGYPSPGVVLPPGYMVCPDPALHLPQPSTGPERSTPAGPAPTGGDATAPESSRPDGPEKPPVDPTAGTLGS